QTFLIFLSNRNHPDESGNVGSVRSKLATLAGEAITDYNFAYVPGSLERPEEQSTRSVSSKTLKKALNGIDVLKREKFARLKGLRLGLVTNHTGVDRERNTTIDLLKEAPGVQLKALFSPEHGIRGEADEKIGDSVDQKTGLPVYSLYGERRVPSPEQLKDLDALVFDIQDIGCRFYTYTATLGLCLEAAAKANIKYIVLDRVEPINATSIEGPVTDGTNNFVAYHSRPLRYGMTAGELAKMYNAERKFGADLAVVQVENWTRDEWFDETGLPWVNQSPNMRNLIQATLYPGIGLHESALSVGRGTDTPFEVVGAPYIDDVLLAEKLNTAGLEGVRFVPIRFKPTYSTFKDKNCAGVFIVVTDRDKLNSVDVGIELARILYQLYPKDFAIQKMHPLVLDAQTIADIKANKSLAEIKRAWAHDLLTYKMRREPFLLYK
ncbi:MAG: pbpE 6, partial [Verrucomicrobiales bacterium]|nr:pbpE 6 [Verrucomicrobiales bacterium]